MDKFKEAIADYTTIINIEEKNTKCLFERASLYDKIGNIDSAIADLTKVVTYEPVNANAYMKRGNLYEKNQKNTRQR